jgi:succinate dehydrogenase/fumarate reductase flavoprotein subunit
MMAGQKSYQFDLVVIGSGPGGFAAANRAIDFGLNVALIEDIIVSEWNPGDPVTQTLKP